MSRTSTAVTIAAPVALTALAAVFGYRHHSLHEHPTVVTTIARATTWVGDTVPEGWLTVIARRDLGHLATRQQAAARALEIVRACGAPRPRVISCKRMTLREAIEQTQRDPDDDFDLGSAGYGGSASLAEVWRVQLDAVRFPNSTPLVASSRSDRRASSTAVLVIASAGGSLVDMTLGYPVSL